MWMRTSTPRNLPIGKDHPRIFNHCMRCHPTVRTPDGIPCLDACDCRYLSLPSLGCPAWSSDSPHQRSLRETLFNILAPRLEGCRFVDLYAGTGAVGIEAISRGAEHVWFAENAEPALASLRQNLAALKISRGFTLEDRGVGALLQRLGKLPKPVDVVYLDPPTKPRTNIRARSTSLAACGAVQFLVKVRWLLREHEQQVEACGALRCARTHSSAEAGRCSAQFFLPLWRLSKAPTLMLTGKQINRKGNLAVCQQVPPHAVQHVAVDAGDSDSLPAQTSGLPRESVPAPRHDCVEADTQQLLPRHNVRTSTTGLSAMWVQRSGCAVLIM